MRDLIRATKALSDETRLRILNLIMEQECCVCQVMQALEISQTRASRNLKVLYDAGFLKLRNEGLWSLYSLDVEGMDGSFAHLLEAVKTALEAQGHWGMTVSEVSGRGRQKGLAVPGRRAYRVEFLPKLKLEVVVPDEAVTQTISAITTKGSR